MTDSFCHLHVHTEYSMLDGASRIADLFEAAARMGMPAISVTDHGVMYGALDFYRAGSETGVKPILGAELYVATRSRFEKSGREKDSSYHMTVLAETDEGYQNLLSLVSAAHLEGYYYRPRVDKELLAEHAKGLIATTGCLASETNQLLLAGRKGDAEAVVGEYREIFGPGSFFVEMQDHGIADQHTVMPDLLAIARRTGTPLLATNDTHYTRREDASAHDVLLCIQTGSTIGDPKRLKFDGEEFFLKSPEQMRALFAEHSEACDNTLAVAERCNVSIEFGTLRLPAFEPPTGEAAEAYLRRLAEEGAARRYGSPLPEAARERLQHELRIVVEMGFAGYFLIVADLIAFARERGIRVGPGRGSAAGSVVSYCLGIVDIDPLRYGLIFERFLNPGRRELPDIDMDFDDRRRSEVIEYVTKKYGEDRVAQIVTFATIKGKQAIRDAARVLGYPYGTGDRLAKMYPPAILGRDAPLAACFDRTYSWPDPGRNDAWPNATDLRQAYGEDEIAQKVLDIARQLEGLRRQASVHAAGVVIADQPLVRYTPLKRADDDQGGVVTQYEMHGIERLGLLKMDFLGLRNLTVIEDTIANVRKTKGIELDVDGVPLDDEPTYEMLRAGNTVGVFQLESAGMRELVKRLAPDRFEDVMALVALYRPGPLGEGMHKEYADRKHGIRKVDYPHADLQPILGDTYGVILYQEQALRIAVDMAGVTMEEADTLRKAIGKKIPHVMRAQREKFVAGCVEKGYAKDLAEKLWEMIDHFSGYGFNKCLVGPTRIPDAETGRVWTMEELSRSDGRIRVSSLGDDGKRVAASIGKVWSNGIRPVLRLRTRLGKELVATHNHPLYTFQGWRTLGELRPGDRIAAPRELPAGTASWAQHELATLGWVLSEGNTCHPSGFYLYSKDPEQARDMQEAVSLFEDTTTTVRLRRGLHEIYVRSACSGDGRFRKGRAGLGDAMRSGARLWLESLGLSGEKATSKFIPAEVFELCRDDLAVLIGRLWSGDGFLYSSNNSTPYYATSSPRLAHDLQELLLHAGMVSRIATKSFPYRDGVKPGYAIYLANPESIERFVVLVGPHLVGRDGQLESLTAYLSRLEVSRSSKDTVPAAVRGVVRREKVLCGVRWGDLETATGLSMREMHGENPNKRGFRRSTLHTLAEHLGSAELRRWAEADIYWDAVVSIEPAGEAEVFDLEVPGPHNFVAEGLYVHNSHSCGYAYIAYQTAYLKRAHPAEYMAALLTSVKDNQDRTALYLAECRTLGITVHPPDVNVSDSDYTPTADGSIRFGLSAVRNVGENVVEEIVRARREKGAFGSFSDFCLKVSPVALNRRVVESLAKAGAFDSLGIPRSALLTSDPEKGLVLAEAAAGATDAAVDRARNEERGQYSLFGGGDGVPGAGLHDPLPGPDLPRDAVLAAEKDMLGLYVSEHPLLAVEEALRVSTDTAVADLEDVSEGKGCVVGGLVTRLAKKFTKKGEAMAVFWLEDLGGAVEVVMFPSLYQKAAEVLVSDSVVCVRGRVDRRDDRPKVVAVEVWRPNLADGGDPLVLNVPAESCTPRLIERLRGVLEAFPGRIPVHLRLTSAGGAKVLRLPSFRVSKESGLYAEVKALLGPRALE